MSNQWEGVVVENGQLPATIRKYGAPAHSKPHGADKTILYYEKPASANDEVPEVVDFAGTVTPANRLRVVHQPTGAGVSGSSVTGSIVTAPSGRSSVGIGVANAYANPNDRTRGSKIINSEALNAEILDQEADALSDRAAAGDKGTTVQDHRPRANHGYIGGATPWVGASADTRFGTGLGHAADIPFLDNTQARNLEDALKSGDADAISYVMSLVPVAAPAESDAGADRFSELSTRDDGAENDISPREAEVEMVPASEARPSPASEASTPPVAKSETSAPQPETTGDSNTVSSSTDASAETLERGISRVETNSTPDIAPVERLTEGDIQNRVDTGIFSRAIEKVKERAEALTGGGEKSPEEKLKEAHPDWTFAFLDAKLKPELEALAEEVRELGIVVERTDGKDEPLRKSDYVATLRVDK